MAHILSRGDKECSAQDRSGHGRPERDRSGRARMDFWGVARFYIPLSMTSFLIMISHNVVNAGIARGANPEVGLAAFRMAKSLTLMIENPVFMVRQTTVSLVTGVRSFKLVSRIFMTVTLFLALVLGIFAIPGCGDYVFAQLFGASQETAFSARLAMAVLFILPMVSCNRNLYHGAAVLTHQTKLVPFATGVRVVFCFALMIALTQLRGISGALMGAILFVGGLSIESLVTYLSARDSVKQISRFRSDQDAGTGLAVRDVVVFFVPLMFTSLMQQVTMPAINTRIGFGSLAFPEIPVAAFAAGWDLGQLLLSPVSMLHQVSMMFSHNEDSEVRAAVKQFCIVWVGLVAAAMAAVSFSPLGRLLLEQVIGVSEELSLQAIWVLRILSFVVLVRGWREYLWGICMQRRITKSIGSARTAGLVVILLMVFAGIRTLDWYPSIVVTGALGVGEIIETTLVAISLKRASTCAIYGDALHQT
ncbi:MAG: hypothetical protein GXX08_11375 [Firmicutes bacterium]|nr:hypothetical protein [Bacillota bacterium]